MNALKLTLTNNHLTALKIKMFRTLRALRVASRERRTAAAAGLGVRNDDVKSESKCQETVFITNAMNTIKVLITPVTLLLMLSAANAVAQIYNWSTIAGFAGGSADGTNTSALFYHPFGRDF